MILLDGENHFLQYFGAYLVQKELKIAAIGGKDSMSGSYNELDVPPTLVSFCIGETDTTKVVSNEFKETNSKVVFLPTKMGEEDILDFEDLKENYEIIHELIEQGKVLSVSTVTHGGIADVITKSTFGNKIGFKFQDELPNLFYPYYGSFIIELKEGVEVEKAKVLGTTTAEEKIVVNCEVSFSLDELIKMWEKPLEKVFPTKVKAENRKAKNIISDKSCTITRKMPITKPRVFVPVFPGTNCEYDSAKAFERAGAEPIVKVFKNLSAEDIRDSVDVFVKAIDQSQIIMFPGGFSAGDEPEGSAKFFATAFRNQKIAEALKRLLTQRDGLMLGICNGFQALIKLGLVPYGEIRQQNTDSPTLTYNTIGRHISKMVYTKVVTNKSPWLAQAELGMTYCNPASHGEGRFVAPKEWLEKLFANGQVATQYVNEQGQPTMDEEWNINGSYMAIEGITSPDGRVLGKMAHSERRGEGVAVNIYGEQDMKLFESGVAYFK